MNRIYFEDYAYGLGLNLNRKGEGYLNKKTQNIFDGWEGAIAESRKYRKYQVKKYFVSILKSFAIATILLLVLAEIYAMLHFALKYW